MSARPQAPDDLGSGAPPDVVYVLRDGPNPELRYSLRTLANLPHGRVWASGGAPIWLAPTVDRIAVDQTAGKHRNSGMNLRAAVASDDVSEHFYLFNDDYFILDPVEQVRVYHRGPLAEVLRFYEDHHPTSKYTAGMRTTLELLLSRGIREPLSYEVHAPLLIVKSDARWVNARLDDLRAKGVYDGLIHWRTVYGNLCSIGGRRIRDVKVYDDASAPIRPLASTSDHAFAQGVAGQLIRAEFPTLSPFELERPPIMVSTIKLHRPLTTVIVGVRFTHGVAKASLSAAQRRFLTARGAKIIDEVPETEATPPAAPPPPAPPEPPAAPAPPSPVDLPTTDAAPIAEKPKRRWNGRKKDAE